MKVVDINERRKKMLNSKELKSISKDNKKQLKDVEKFERELEGGFNIVDETEVFEEFEDVEQTSEDFLDDFDMLANTSYYYSLNELEVRFGGAFVKDIISKIEENKVEILKSIEISNDRSKYYLSKALDEDDKRYKLLLKTLEDQEVLMDEIINNIKTPYDLDEMFREGSKHLKIIGFVLTIAMVHSYTQFDYHRMLRDKWIELSIPIEEFMSSQLYEEIKESGYED